MKGDRVMTLTPDGGTNTARKSVLADLKELIAAIDRRVPHLERQGEHRIVQEAAALRRQAAERIAELEAMTPDTP